MLLGFKKIISGGYSYSMTVTVLYNDIYGGKVLKQGRQPSRLFNPFESNDHW